MKEEERESSGGFEDGEEEEGEGRKQVREAQKVKRLFLSARTKSWSGKERRKSVR